MFDERGARIKDAGPSMPVSVLGFDGGQVPVISSTYLKTKKKQDQLLTSVNNFSVSKVFVLRRPLLLKSLEDVLRLENSRSLTLSLKETWTVLSKHLVIHFRNFLRRRFR